MTDLVLAVLILVLAIPIGLLIAWLSREELVAGRNWFSFLAMVSLILGFVFSFLRAEVAFSLLFASVISIVAIWKSKDKKWTSSKV